MNDFDKLMRQFAEDFPEEAAKKKCSDCVFSAWARVSSDEGKEAFAPYCSELKFALKTLVEADTCVSFSPR